MNVKIFRVLVLLLVSAGCTEWRPFGSGDDLFVAADAPAAGADGSRRHPFPSIAAAQHAIRAARATRTRAVTVRIAPGDYDLSEPLLFTPEDSGTPDAPIRYIGSGDGADGTCVNGSRVLTGWRETAPGRWEAPIPADATGEPLWFETLWVNGRRAVRARHPNTGFFNPAHLVQTEVTNTAPRFVYGRAALTASNADLRLLSDTPPESLKYAQLVVHHNWDTTRRIIVAFDKTRQTVLTCGRPWKHWNPWRTNSLYYVENVPAALDAPGEWLYDGVARKIVYLACPGEKRASSVFRYPLPGLKQTIIIRGRPAQKEFVHDLVFEGIQFRHTDSPRRADQLRASGLPLSLTGAPDRPGPAQWTPNQASAHTEASILADGAHRIVFRRCRIAHTGEYGLWLREGCVSNQVEMCELSDLGAGGIRIGLPNATQPIAPGERVTGLVNGRGTGYNTVDNCIIAHGGRYHAPGVAVWIGSSPFNTITHCDIYDHYYTGVSIGWVWGYGGSLAQGNTLSFCRIRNIGQRALGDMGGLYTLGTSYGTCVSNNVISHVDSYTYGGWGLYTDEGSEGIVMENNLVYDTKDGSFHQHYGKNNLLRNNILCNSRQCQVACTRKEEHCPFTFEHNIVWSGRGPMVGKRYRGSDQPGIVWRSNLWWRVGGEAEFCGKTFTDWQIGGRDAGSECTDPLFVNPSENDFRLAPNSPAFRLGFRPFDPACAGLYGPAEWRARAARD